LCWYCSCISAHEIAPEGKYPAIFDQNSDPVVLGKIKRIKSMQPKSFDEEEIARNGNYIIIIIVQTKIIDMEIFREILLQDYL